MNLGDGMDVQFLVLHAREARQPEAYGLQHRSIASGPVVGKRNHIELTYLHIRAVTVHVFEAHIEIFCLAHRVQGSAVKDLRYAERNITIRGNVFVSRRHVEDVFRSLRAPAPDQTVRVLKKRVVEGPTELAEGELAKR